MTMTPPVAPDGIVTLRELYSLLDKTRAELLLEIQKLQTSVDKKFQDHDAVHVKHDASHEKEHSHQTSLVRWGVTTILSAIGIAIAIYVAFKSGG